MTRSDIHSSRSFLRHLWLNEHPTRMMSFWRSAELHLVTVIITIMHQVSMSPPNEHNCASLTCVDQWTSSKVLGAPVVFEENVFQDSFTCLLILVPLATNTILEVSSVAPLASTSTKAIKLTTTKP
ncbi:hypothetical protein BDR07DRAFT_1411092 [Suillus spraguei]|nr:hypothetical protein BDR07DRAFT_1411092 [Suillus spraguei]